MFYKRIKAGMMLSLVCMFFINASCEKTGQEIVGKPEIEAKKAEVGHEKGSMFIIVTADGGWRLELDFGGKDSWAELSEYSGSGNKSNIVLRYDENTGDESRKLDVVLTADNGEASCSIIQKAAGKQDNPEEGVINAKWMELPAMSADDGLYCHTHFMSLDGRDFRNYSFGWDSENLVAHWVAYPLNKWTIGTQDAGRGSWALDPDFTIDMQPDFIKGGIGTQGYDRGHQIPSADRQNEDSNAQTFYMTNITPQLPNFNQQIWANFESKVRSWAENSDTLYVVTGCVVEGSKTSIKDNAGKDVTVPAAYFKALLRYSKASTVGISGYMAAGFYLEHRNYDEKNIDKSMSISIRELEKKTGLDFFVNLESQLGADVYSQIEEQQPSSNSWWWN